MYLAQPALAPSARGRLGRHPLGVGRRRISGLGRLAATPAPTSASFFSQILSAARARQAAAAAKTTAAKPVLPAQICPAWGCGAPPITIQPFPVSTLPRPPVVVRRWTSTGARRTTIPPATVNPPGGPPGTILKYSAQGNPVYAVPPPGQIVVGRDASGTPLYATPAAAASAGLTVVGADASGHPIYSSTTTALAPAGTPASAPAAPLQTSATPSSYQSILDWLSQQTLVSGMPNWGLVAGLGLAALWLKNRGRR